MLNAVIQPQTNLNYGNKLLSMLLQDNDACKDQLDLIELTRGESLLIAGQGIRYVYFPVNCIVALECELDDGNCAEFALIGREGLVGISTFTGNKTITYNANVLCEGQAWRIPARVMAPLFEQNERFRRIMLDYTQALMTDAIHKVVCLRRHTIEQQLTRILLVCLDRKEQEELVVTQEQIARTMGVRREAITLAAQRLQATGLISYVRGRITLQDRAGIEALTCPCYKVSADAYKGVAHHA